jgi:hypothetical protein
VGPCWTLAEIVTRGADALRAAEDALWLEQAVRGIEALDELDVQGLLARGLAAQGPGQTPAWGVLREVPYPTPPQRRALRRDRARCDIVLTARAGDVLTDLVVRARERDAIEGTLFASLLEDQDANAPEERTVGPEEAMWIEVKTLGQYAYRDGVPGPNRAYASELCQGVLSDARKLGADPRIGHGAALCVLFAASEEVARHDAGVAVHRMLDQGAPIASMEIICFPIPDRIGNGVCAVVGLGIRCLGLSD